MARADSGAAVFYGAQVGEVGSTTDAVLNIVRSVTNNNPITIASVDLFTKVGLVLNTGTQYNLKLLVQTDATNTSETDLYADVWRQGQPDPGWELSTTDHATILNGTGSNASGYDGILAAPNYDGESTDTSYLSNYVESNTPGDLPEINSFTASPTNVSGNGTVLFNATATAPATYLPGGPGTTPVSESITSYVLNFGDPGSTPLTTTSLANVIHTYTTNNSYDAYTAALTVTDTSGSETSESLTVETNPSVTTDPTGTLIINRDGGNGINAGNPLVVQFTSSGTPDIGTRY